MIVKLSPGEKCLSFVLAQATSLYGPPAPTRVDQGHACKDEVKMIM